MAGPRLCAGREPVYVPVAQRWIQPGNGPRAAPGSGWDGPGHRVPAQAAEQSGSTFLAGPGHFQPPPNVPRPADTCSVAAGEADESVRSRKSGDGPGPGHFQPPDHVRQQVRALMAEYFPPPRTAIDAA